METMTFEVATTRSFFVAWRIVSPPLPLVKVATENVTLRPSIRFVRLQHAPQLINLHDNVVYLFLLLSALEICRLHGTVTVHNSDNNSIVINNSNSSRVMQ